jgi:large subunit ribosomal protein L25
MVMIRDIKRDPLTQELLHVDFFQVEMTHKVKAEVPLLFIGEAPAAKSSRVMLIENLTTLHLEALPADLPRNIEVDLSVLEEIGQAIHVRDIQVDEGIEVLTEAGHVVVKVMEARVEEVVEEVEAEVEAEAEGTAESEED